MDRPDYRPFVPASSESSIVGATPRAHAQARVQIPRVKELFETWAKLGAEPFKGLTTDGKVQPGLFSLQADNAPAAAMIEAVRILLAVLSPAQRHVMCFPVDSQMWRHWQNTELYVEHHGLRLDEVDDSIKQTVMAVLRASLSGKGYQITRDVMRLNQFLGDLVGGPAVLGEWAYSAEGDKPDDPNLDAKTALMDPMGPRVTLVRGFLEIPVLKGIITDSHFAKRDRMGRLLVFLARIQSSDNPNIRGIGVDEGAAVLVEPDGTATVVGKTKAYFLMPFPPAPKLQPGKPLNRVFYSQRVGAGGSFDLKKWCCGIGPDDLIVEDGKIRWFQDSGPVY